jgi:hypothetical protein
MICIIEDAANLRQHGAIIGWVPNEGTHASIECRLEVVCFHDAAKLNRWWQHLAILVNLSDRGISLANFGLDHKTSECGVRVGDPLVCIVAKMHSIVRNFQQNEQKLQKTTYRGEGFRSRWYFWNLWSKFARLLKTMRVFCKYQILQHAGGQQPNSLTRWWSTFEFKEAMILQNNHARFVRLLSIKVSEPGNIWTSVLFFGNEMLLHSCVESVTRVFIDAKIVLHTSRVSWNDNNNTIESKMKLLCVLIACCQPIFSPSPKKIYYQQYCKNTIWTKLQTLCLSSSSLSNIERIVYYYLEWTNARIISLKCN